MQTPMTAIMVETSSASDSPHARAAAPGRYSLLAIGAAFVSPSPRQRIMNSRRIPRQRPGRRARLETTFELCDLARPLPFGRQRRLPQARANVIRRAVRLEAQLVFLAALVAVAAQVIVDTCRVTKHSDLTAGAGRHLDQRHRQTIDARAIARLQQHAVDRKLEQIVLGALGALARRTRRCGSCRRDRRSTTVNSERPRRVWK